MYDFSDIYKVPIMSFGEGDQNDPYGDGIGAPWSTWEEDPFDPYRGGMETPQIIVPPASESPSPGPTFWGPVGYGLVGGLVAMAGVACWAYRWWTRRVQRLPGKLSGLFHVYNLYYF